MKKRLFTVMIACMLAAAGCGPMKKDSRQPSAENAADRSVKQAKELTQDIGIGINIDYSKPSMEPVQKFGYQLLQHNMEEKNPLLSPVSAYVVLCMLGNGAQGATKEEIQHVLGGDLMCIPDDLMNTLDTKLSMANSAWMDDQFTAHDEWLGTIKSLFDAQVYQADLQAGTTTDDINEWVSGHTNGKIPELIDQPFDESVVLVLLNALYLQADWEQQFEPENTFDWDFTSDDGETKRVPMMHNLIEDCAYIKDDTAEGVILPYKDSNLAFVAVKPSGGENIREWYSAYSYKKLQDLIKSRKNTLVSFGMPKFTVRFRKNLNESLKSMGIQLAFDPSQADLSLLGASSDGEGLYLSIVLQETEIETGEKGTKAAAATMAAESGGGMPQDLQEVQLDRSFFYMIMDMESGAPVFMGILDQPE